MPADRRLYLFRVSEAAWNAAATEVPVGSLAGRPLSGLEVRRATVNGDRVIGVVVTLGADAQQLDAALPGSDDGFAAFFMTEVEAGDDPYSVSVDLRDAAKAALGSATPIS